MQPVAAAHATMPVRWLADRLPALAVLAFGGVLLYGVGFSTLSMAHNAAHDTRHATGFPCH
jgi:cobalt transporter subunit CbtB